MRHNPTPVPRKHHRTRPLLIGGLTVVIAVLTMLLGHQVLKSAASAAPSTGASAHTSPTSRDERRGGIGEADGVVPDGVTVFDGVPAVTHLDPDLRDALREAATDAHDHGVTFYVNSGWRSPDYQDQLLSEAVTQYGSEAQAARWVATADTSLHVKGAAVDLGESAATTWLSEHGAAYGLCQVYENEPWHYELRPDAADHGCPAPYADPTQDPRMQQ